MEEIPVECPECDGAGEIDELECPVCDGDGSVEGGVRTISLHNIRYEMAHNGGKLWVEEGGREVVKGSVYQARDGERWQAWYMGALLGSYATEETAIQVLKAVAKVQLEGAG